VKLLLIHRKQHEHKGRFDRKCLFDCSTATDTKQAKWAKRRAASSTKQLAALPPPHSLPPQYQALELCNQIQVSNATLLVISSLTALATASAAPAIYPARAEIGATPGKKLAGKVGIGISAVVPQVWVARSSVMVGAE
jgi:hypothetical protein